jgi:hypothetical protein
VEEWERQESLKESVDAGRMENWNVGILGLNIIPITQCSKSLLKGRMLWKRNL